MTTATRPRLRDHLHVGLRVIRTADHHVLRINNIWRADDQVQLVDRDTGERSTVSYSELVQGYAMVQPFTGGVR